MARGFMFEVSRDKNSLGQINAGFYDTYPLPSGVDGVRNDDRASKTIEVLFKDLKEFGVLIDNSSNSVQFSLESKKNMFHERFVKFKDLVDNMSEEDFVNDVYTYMSTLECSTGDLVYDVDAGCVYDWDNWIRTVPNNELIYFGNVMVIR